MSETEKVEEFREDKNGRDESFGGLNEQNNN